MTKLEQGQIVEHDGTDVKILLFREEITAVDDGEPVRETIVEYTTLTDQDLIPEHKQYWEPWDEFVSNLASLGDSDG